MLASPTIDEALCWAQAQLQEASFQHSAAYYEARYLLSDIVGRDRSYLAGFGEVRLSSSQMHLYERHLARRAAGVPLAYIRGQQEFYGLDFYCGGDILIPRADSEILVDCGLSFAVGKRSLRVLDMGCGTGALGISLAVNLAQHSGSVSVLDLVDIDSEAVALAQANAERHLRERDIEVSVRLGNWFGEVAGAYDIILCNPPYIASDDWVYLPRSVRLYQSWRSLWGGCGGLQAYSLLSCEARSHMADGGVLIVEVGCAQATVVATLFADMGWECICIPRDLGGIERALVLRLG